MPKVKRNEKKTAAPSSKQNIMNGTILLQTNKINIHIYFIFNILIYFCTYWILVNIINGQ